MQPELPEPSAQQKPADDGPSSNSEPVLGWDSELEEEIPADIPDGPEASPAPEATPPVQAASGWDFGYEPFGPPSPPSAIEAEEKHLASAYTELEEVESKELLSQAFLAELVRPFFKISSGDISDVEVKSLLLRGDAERTLLWLNYGGLEHLLVILDPEDGVKERIHLEGRAQVRARDVVGDTAQEIFVERILGSGLSTYPAEWSIYRVTTWGKLRLLLTQAKSHSSGSKYTSWAYMKHFDFEDRTSLELRTIHSGCAEDEFIKNCPAADSVIRFKYNPSRDRYEKVWQAKPSRSQGGKTGKIKKGSHKPIPHGDW